MHSLEKFQRRTRPVVGYVRGIPGSHCESRVVEPAPAALRVPFIAAPYPGQLRGHGGHHEVNGPADDHVVIEGNVPRDQNGAKADAYGRKRISVEY